MAAVVSHAMRRLPTSPPDTVYSYSLRSESSKNWSEDGGGVGGVVGCNGGESALSRSMRYADPWLYGSVRSAPTGLLLAAAPAFVLCTCPDYVNGTKRSSKKSSTSCKKCKGTRLPLNGSTTKFGTVRCYPTGNTTMASTPLRAGTMRVLSTSSARPSILPSADPYDLMRRSRLSVPEANASQFRNRSISPHKGRTAEARRKNGSLETNYNATFGRKSILECDINPYELMSSESHDSKETSITLVNGQRIRVRPQSSEEDYEDVHIRSPYSPKSVKSAPILNGLSPKSPPSKRDLTIECNSSGGGSLHINHQTNSNRFKSILKKRASTFNDTDLTNGPELTPSPSSATLNNKSGSHFYIPMPSCSTTTTPNNTSPRKKVQFLVENELVCQENDHENRKAPEEEAIPTSPPPQQAEDAQPKNGQTEIKPCKLRRSVSERINHEQAKVVFHDTMALRNRTRGDSRAIFAEKDLERLDGVTSRIRKISPDKPRPNVPPPPPPKQEEIPEPTKQFVEELIIVEQQEVCNVVEPPVITPPSAPPRKRSNNKQPLNNSSTILITNEPTNNKTVVQINTSNSIHKLKIKNDFASFDQDNIQTVSVLDNPQRKTSILINGDDCYSTVNVNDDIPLYQSSVVVKDSGGVGLDLITSPTTPKMSSSVYITGSFTEVTKDSNSNLVESFNQTDIPSSDRLKELLRDPVEAVRRNLVPHVCGKSDVARRSDPILSTLTLTNNSSFEHSISSNAIEESLMRLQNYEASDDCSEHSSSTQYELMDPGSDCYTDHSNRSSVTEEELANRTKFYELLADSAVEVFDSDDHHYESIKINPDPIYEEIEIPPPLPSNPPPSSLLDDIHLDKEFTTRSIFEGASKYDILSYLVDAKERGIVKEDSYTFNYSTNHSSNEEEAKEHFNRACHMSTVSDSSEDNSLIISGAIIDDKSFPKNAEVERNDSGVGSETSKSSLSKYRTKQETTTTCEDCETVIEPNLDSEPLLCKKCVKKRSERKEIITEIVETEEKYSRDLQIILEEFYQPMLVAGLLTPDQLATIFLNSEELLENSQALAERLRDAVEIALEQGDDDLLTVNIGKLFLEAAPMLHAFETYCVRQGAASLLLAGLEKEKELLRIFLKVSQMENTMLRRMNLNSFLMVPVQRVTKYPLLLARLYKVTPNHHDTREQLKEAQHKIELHLNHMNSETKDVPSKLWRRIGSSSGRRSSAEMDLVNIKLRKIAVDVLEWNHDEAKFALEGKLLFTQPTDNNWRKGRTIKLAPINALLVINGKTKSDKTDENSLIFSRHSGIREAALLLVRDKNGRYSLLREPLYLDRCVIAADPAWQSYFEVQELLGKDTFIFKAEDDDQTSIWYKQLQYHAQGMGAWRKRRNALANIMINGMGLRS